MEKEKEKQTIYSRVVELTENAEPNKYFSKSMIYQYIKDCIESEVGSFVTHIDSREIGPRKVFKYIGGKDFEEVCLDEIYPRQKSMRPLLEELVTEGKIEKVSIQYCGEGYRAKEFSKSL